MLFKINDNLLYKIYLCYKIKKKFEKIVKIYMLTKAQGFKK